MQNTRLNTLIDSALARSQQWLQNPWRRTSLVIISLLFGNFLASAIATLAGQNADWDIVVSAILVALSETVSWFVYRGSRGAVQAKRLGQRALGIEILNALKMGLMYGLFVEAFKIGS
jgi:Protein of unknown function (DUF565)